MTSVKGPNIKSITGIVEGQTLIDWSGQNLELFDVKILAADIEFTPFHAVALSEVNLSNQNLFGPRFSSNPDLGGWSAFCDAICKCPIRKLDINDINMGLAGLTIFAKIFNSDSPVYYTLLTLSTIYDVYIYVEPVALNQHTQHKTSF